MRSDNTAVEQRTLTGETADSPRAVPETMIHCEECDDVVLRSRRHDHEHDLSDSDLSLSPKTAQSLKKVPVDAICDSRYEDVLSYALL